MKALADIIREAIAQYDADGLCNGECGCSRNDLFPCGEPQLDCVLAKIRKPKEHEQRYYDIDPDDDWFTSLK